MHRHHKKIQNDFTLFAMVFSILGPVLAVFSFTSDIITAAIGDRYWVAAFVILSVVCSSIILNYDYRKATNKSYYYLQKTALMGFLFMGTYYTFILAWMKTP